MRAAPDCRPPPTARHVLQPRSRSTSHPPQQQDAVHRELRPGTGKGARAGAGPLRRAARPAGGPARAPPPRTTAPPPQPLATRSLPTTTGQRKGGHPVVSNRPLHSVMQQRCHHASASARSPSCGERRFSSALGNRVLIVNRRATPFNYNTMPIVCVRVSGSVGRLQECEL
jgi:hypothetical protein